MNLTSPLSPVSPSRIRPSANDVRIESRSTRQSMMPFLLPATICIYQRTDKGNLPAIVYFTTTLPKLNPGNKHQGINFYRTLNAASKLGLVRTSQKSNRKVEGKPYPLLEQGFRVRVSPRRVRKISALCPRRCPRQCPRPCPCPRPQSVRVMSTSCPQPVRNPSEVMSAPCPRRCPHTFRDLSGPCPQGVRDASVPVSALCPHDHE